MYSEVVVNCSPDACAVKKGLTSIIITIIDTMWFGGRFFKRMMHHMGIVIASILVGHQNNGCEGEISIIGSAKILV